MSIKINIFYSLVLTTANYIFPLLVYPYVSRVLGVEGIGICNYIDSIINYFVLFSMLGISIIGIREIASVKENRNKLDVKFTSLIIHTGLPTVLSSMAFLACFILVPQLSCYREFMYIGLAKILGMVFTIDWFYKGIEDFKYITKCTIIVKVFYVISVFVFIKSSDDYFTYFLLTSLMVVVNSVINLIYCRKYVSFSFNYEDFKSLIKPNLINGFYLFLNSMYISLNVAILGFVSDAIQVGYYTTANKIFGIILSVYTAFTGVMLPRMSALANESNDNQFQVLIDKSLNVLISFTLPVAIICTILAPDIINVISGVGYEGAYIPARICMPLIFIVGYEQILVVQILTPLREDKIKFINSIIGALVGIILNLLLVRHFFAIGATIVWFCSEFSVLVMAQYFVKKRIGLGFPFKKIMKEIQFYLPLAISAIALTRVDLGSFTKVGLAVIVSSIYFVLINIYVKKNDIILSLIKIKKE